MAAVRLMSRELEDKLIIGHVYENIKKHNMPGGILVTRQVSGTFAAYSIFFFPWQLLLLSDS